MLPTVSAMRRAALVFVASQFVLSASPVAAAEGAALFATCTACHGKGGEGNDALGAPSIGGQDAWYIERQLANFAEGRRGTKAADTHGKQMAAAVASVKAPAQRAAVAAYIAGLPKVGTGRTANVAGDISKGRTHYNALCTSCHGATGQGNKSLGAPRLNNLSAAYLARQIGNFKQALRGYHDEDKLGKQMAAISRLLPDASAERDVIAYLLSLKP
jgi:cytochrome c oxidase subunit 2